MKKNLILLCLIFTCIGKIMGQTSTNLSWQMAAQDVLIDGEVDHTIQVFECEQPQQIMLTGTKLNKYIIVKPNDDSIYTISKDSVSLSADSASATSNSNLSMQSNGKITRIDFPNIPTVYSFVYESKLMTISPHPDIVGEMTEEQLWQGFPSWHAAMQSYKPSSDDTKNIKNIDKETSLTLFFGTWCSDSRYHIPRLLKTLHEANNQKLTIKLVGIDHEFYQPEDTVQPKHLTNVPTVIVERNRTELGRFVETPATETIENDIINISNGKTLIHNGRWKRKEKYCTGTYIYKNSNGKSIGEEAWEIFNTEDGGYLVKSEIKKDGINTTIFSRVNSDKHPVFIEVTKDIKENIMRTRYNIEGDFLYARTRGNLSGIVTQSLKISNQEEIISPSLVTQGWGLKNISGTMPEYLIPLDTAPLGALVNITCKIQKKQNLSMLGKNFQVQHLICEKGNDQTEFWLDSELGIPIRAKLANGIECTLTSLEFDKFRSTIKKH